ncbi:MAG TPA: hypothetical protein PKH77_27710 [Anaerolineae bacterium]|nr:hypothetical protein [Anaerolineae bacterium]
MKKNAINWDEIQHCALELGYTLEELNSTIARIAQEVNFTDIRTLK